MQNSGMLNRQTNAAQAAPAAPRAVAGVRKSSAKRTGPLLMGFCMVFALITVLVVPMVTGGATTVSSSASAQNVSEESLTSLSQVEQVMGYMPAVPSQLPQNYGLIELKVLDSKVLEAVYTDGKTSFVYRTAKGNEDPSGIDSEFLYSALAEGQDGVVRSYSGPSAEKLKLAVWTEGGSSYSIWVKDGMAGTTLKELSENVG